MTTTHAPAHAQGINAFTIAHVSDAMPTLVCRYCANAFIVKHTNVEPIAVALVLSGTGYEFGMWEVIPTHTSPADTCQFCGEEVGA
jgi:hypothetical protein